MQIQIRKYRKQIIFMIDIVIILSVFSVFSLLLTKDYTFSRVGIVQILPHMALLIICNTLSHHIFKTYRNLWRYAECKEYLTLLQGGACGFFGFMISDYIIFRSPIPILLLMAVYSVSLLLMLLIRFYYRIIRMQNLRRKTQGKIPIAIIGAGTAGVRLLDEIKNDKNSKYATYCFIDDSIEKIGKYIHHVEIKGPIRDIHHLLQDTPVKELIIAMPLISPAKRIEILDYCSTLKCSVKILPDTLFLMENEDVSLTKGIRDVNIEELLGRDPVVLDGLEIHQFITDKVVMVTGGGGSIGSELCRQIAKENPRKLIIVDIYENNAYDIQQELKYHFKDSLDIRVEIASVREEDRVNSLFEQYRPNIVFHAAAHKHVPLMEDCPGEAIKNNILGTYHVVKASDKYGVDKFVLISTDKAVNPTSIMGASKRFCEMLLQSMKQVSKTEFVSVRFGNVLGSNGSVIPLFKRQIEQGGPVTVTDKRIIRYFMTIPEAAQLVLQAGAMANSAEIYVLDMGQPVKILDLAEKLIRLSGFEPYTEIPIEEIGLRPGEKLFEEMLMESEELIATTNNKIFIERQKEISPEDRDRMLEILTRALATEDKSVIKEAFKQVVPNYTDPDEINMYISEIRMENEDTDLDDLSEVNDRNEG